MGARQFLLPDLGEGLEDAEIVEWRVSVGDPVAVDAPLVEVETAKANVELPCPYAGTVTSLHGAPGDRVVVGAPLVTIEVADSTVAPAPEPAAPDVGEPEPGVAPDRPLVGYGATGGAHATAVITPASTVAQAPRAKAAPPVRKRARELGVELGGVPGTGPLGAVTSADLDRFLDASGPDIATTSAAVSSEPAPSAIVDVRGVRRAVAEKMVTSRREIPDASSWVECDATALVAAREVINARGEGVKVTPLALVLRACVAGLQAFPRLNARFHADREQIEEISAIHLGVAAQTERGLVVPVIRDAQRRTTRDLASELSRLAAGARDGSLTPAELMGSTFTVSNYGAFGVDGGVAIINHPEVAILGVGRFAPKPWVVDGEIKVRTVVELSLSFDHRVMDGGDAGGFLRFVADCVEQPATLLAYT
jgi:2-oxoisovalerate dehydrogenase E2 component (dihydrolipoyl transacylase)